MKNSIQRINSNKKYKIIQEANENNYLIVELNGDTIQSYLDYASVMNIEFDLQMHDVSNKDAYLDWMRDLTWIDKKGFLLIINNFNNFLKDDVEEKKAILEDFENVILPFWDTDVIQCVQGGKAKSFNVFLIA